MKVSLPTKSGFIRELLLLCIIVYFSQGSLFKQGTILTQFTLILIYIISFYYLLKVIFSKSHKNTFIWACTLLLLLNILGYLFTLDLGNNYYFSQIKAIMLFFLPVFPFYYLSQKGKIDERHLLRLFIIMAFITILNFNYSREVILAERISDRVDVVNNVAYSFVFLLPYVFLFKSRLVSIFSMLILFIFIIQGAKRGALIVGIVGALFFIYHQLKVIDVKHRFRDYFIFFVGVLSSVIYLYQYFLNNEYFVSRIDALEEGNSSGRDIIFSNLINGWYNSDNFLNYIFGYGFASTLRLAFGSYAHNDWLELLINFGLVGVMLYTVIFYSLLKTSYRMRSTNSYGLIVLAVTCMWFVTTLFSMVYTSSATMFISIFLAFLLGKENLIKKNTVH